MNSLKREEDATLGKRTPHTIRNSRGLFLQSVSVTDMETPKPTELDENSSVATPVGRYIKSLLAERPVWTLQAVQERASGDKFDYGSVFALKKALCEQTYLFKNGPWKFTYVRFGYDPRRDKGALFYQTFNIGIMNSNFLKTAEDNPSLIDLKQRNFHKIQICDVEDPSIKEMISFIYDQLKKEHHKLSSKRYGWMDKKQYFFISKRIKNVLKN